MSTSIQIRPLFNKGYERISQLLYSREYGNKLCQAFCGCGKSRLAYKSILNSIELGNKLNLILFPSISLITQFNIDYINSHLSSNIFKTLSICSKNELKNELENKLEKSVYKEFSYTTTKCKIQSFINKIYNKIICCTYQSLDTLVDSLGDTKINFTIFDEAHHSEAPNINHLIYNENPFFQLGLFMTATPSQKMKTDMERICYIPYFQALEAQYLKPFELHLDINKKTPLKQDFNIYESISRAILKTGNNRVMTFHAFSNGNNEVNYDSDDSESSMSSYDSKSGLSSYKTRTSVNTFTNQKEFIKAFNIILSSEFPHLKNKYKKITMKGIDCSTKDRRKILKTFDKTEDDEIYILCSCRTIGEGVDTKKANMCVFADPKSSLKDIIQNIGRILRKLFGETTIGTVLIPALIDFNEYSDCKNLEEKDKVLRMNINTNDDFNGILNVVSALKQDSEEYFDQCLMYPKQYLPKNKQKSGKKLEDIIDIKPSNNNLSSDEEKLQHYTDNNNTTIVFTQPNDMDENYETIYGNENENKSDSIIHISKTSDNKGGYKYTLFKPDSEPIKSDDEGSEPDDNTCKKGCKCDRCIEKRKKLLKDKIKINIHIKPEFKVLWKIKDDDYINNIINNAVIECVVERDNTSLDDWKNNLDKVKKYIEENKKTPSQVSKDKNIKSLGGWVSQQKINYKKKIQCMKNKEIYDIWTAFINHPNYIEYLLSSEDDWKNNLDKVKKYIDKNNKKPTPYNKDKDIKSLCKWISHQKTNYKKKIQCMKNTKIYDIWTDFINHPSYKEYLQLSPEDDWNINLNKVKKYIDENKKTPSSTHKDKDIKSLGTWIVSQKKNYKNKLHCMKNINIYDIWTAFINHPNYIEYLLSPEDDWKNNLDKVKKYIDEHKKTPIMSDIDKDIKSLSNWISHQKINYKNKLHSMINTKIYDMWTDFINHPSYKEYLQLSPEDDWNINLNKVKKYIDENKKTPSSKVGDKDIKSLGTWIFSQKDNYKKKIQCMKNTNIYDIWTAFINNPNYREYLLSPDDNWKNNLDKVKKYIDKNNKKPTPYNKDKDIKSLGKWISHQKTNYKNKSHSMENTEIYNIWTEFINNTNYRHYLQSSPEHHWKDNLDNNDIEKKKSVTEKKEDNNKDEKENKGNEKYNCECGSKIKNDTKCINTHKNTKKHKDYLDKKVNITEDKKQNNEEKCVHLWKVVRDDEKYNYKKCELCERESKESRLGKEDGYIEPNPDKKKEINEWFKNQRYNKGKAIVLDAKGLKTSNGLLDSGEFKAEDIIIPEYDEKTYKINKEDKRLGKSVKNGDYLEVMKKYDVDDISLMYADFTGSYNKFVEPLLDYIKENKKKVKIGTIIVITWSNNGAGTTSVRNKIQRNLGKYETDIGMEEIEESPTESGYGDGGCMNVIFYRKK